MAIESAATGTYHGLDEGLAPQEVVAEFRDQVHQDEPDLEVDGLEGSWFKRLRRYFDVHSR